MKILDTWVHDPTYNPLHSGTLPPLVAPSLCVKVDESPTPWRRGVIDHGDWTLEKFGAFYRVKPKEGTYPDYSGVGWINAKLNYYPPLIEVTVILDKDCREMAMPLGRARQLLKKFTDHEWYLKLSERDALEGRILWVPRQVNPECRVCWTRPAYYVLVNNTVEMPLCQKHVRENNERYATRRKQNASK